MAKAELTEEIVRTETVTLVLSMDEARALFSLANRAHGPRDGDGPANRIKSVRDALLDSGMGPAPHDKCFQAQGEVSFTTYREVNA
ncbi:hypothetical protein XF35_01695 [Streptomyces platensis subsp. clarensis]|nr:hypothetical protein [Streptomyces platensis subsp. clarensis]